MKKWYTCEVYTWTFTTRLQRRRRRKILWPQAAYCNSFPFRRMYTVKSDEMSPCAGRYMERKIGYLGLNPQNIQGRYIEYIYPVLTCILYDDMCVWRNFANGFEQWIEHLSSFRGWRKTREMGRRNCQGHPPSSHGKFSRTIAACPAKEWGRTAPHHRRYLVTVAM